MNREEARIFLPVFQAFANGKQIQRKSKITGRWEDSFSPGFTPGYEYRVKPEKTLVPFTFEDKKILEGKWIKHKNYQSCFKIIGVCPDKIMFFGGEISYSTLLESCEFEDGTPCGKYVEE
mgnify:CR=1 FL=1